MNALKTPPPVRIPPLFKQLCHLHDAFLPPVQRLFHRLSPFLRLPCKILYFLLRFLSAILFWLALFVATIGHALSRWENETFGVNIQEILYTIRSPLKGSNTSFSLQVLSAIRPQLLLFLFLVVAILLIDRLIFSKVDMQFRFRLGRVWQISGRSLIRFAIFLFCISVCNAVYWEFDVNMGITDFLNARKYRSTIYEDYYVNPQNVTLTVPAQKKNLIYIYLESMETAYASVEDGGLQEVNYIPNLTALAKENLSFSDTDLPVGGWRPTNGTTWTLGALFSTTSGIPFEFRVDNDTLSQREHFAKGLTNLGDVLEEQGYTQEFLCGSDGEFAGRAEYFQQHGKYTTYDYYKALAVGDIPAGYRVWWGYEDMYLYQIAQKEIIRLAAEGQPFNFTMLTVDTHFPEGYVCRLCGTEHSSTTANVISCADRQIYSFVQWCKTQDFYKDTVIIITGDHPRMDKELVGDKSMWDRTLYNVFLNVDPSLSASARTKNRQFAPMDIFPTVLSALGFGIPDNRLGLGTNLFSDRTTLMEEMGYTTLTNEVSRYSDYYDRNFA